jgi:hypothetical protein
MGKHEEALVQFQKGLEVFLAVALNIYPSLGPLSVVRRSVRRALEMTYN